MAYKLSFTDALLASSAFECAQALVKRSSYRSRSGNKNAILLAVLWSCGYIFRFSGKNGYGSIGTFIMAVITSITAIFQGIKTVGSNSKGDKVLPLIELYENKSFKVGSKQTYKVSNKILTLKAFTNEKDDIFGSPANIIILASGNLTTSELNVALPVVIGYSEENYHIAVGLPRLEACDLVALLSSYKPEITNQRDGSYEVSWALYSWSRANYGAVENDELENEFDSLLPKKKSKANFTKTDEHHELGNSYKEIANGDLYMNG